MSMFWETIFCFPREKKECDELCSSSLFLPLPSRLPPLETILPLGGWAFLGGAKFTRGIPFRLVSSRSDKVWHKILPTKNILSVKRVSDFNHWQLLFNTLNGSQGIHTDSELHSNGTYAQWSELENVFSLEPPRRVFNFLNFFLMVGILENVFSLKPARRVEERDVTTSPAMLWSCTTPPHSPRPCRGKKTLYTTGV